MQRGRLLHLGPWQFGCFRGRGQYPAGFFEGSLRRCLASHDLRSPLKDFLLKERPYRRYTQDIYALKFASLLLGKDGCKQVPNTIIFAPVGNDPFVLSLDENDHDASREGTIRVEQRPNVFIQKRSQG